MIIENWRTVERPGQIGFKKAEFNARMDSQYGAGNWRKAYMFNGRALEQQEAFRICESAYYHHSLDHPELWKRLLEEARDVYDIKPEEIESGLDYSIQHEFTRFHDICIRNVIFKRGWSFQGDKLIQIRHDPKSPNWYSENFDPGKVAFHLPELILMPRASGWWDANSVEDFWQSNKVIQIKE